MWLTAVPQHDTHEPMESATEGEPVATAGAAKKLGRVDWVWPTASCGAQLSGCSDSDRRARTVVSLVESVVVRCDGEQHRVDYSCKD